MNDERSRLPGDLLLKVLERVLAQRILEGVVVAALADLQHENALVRQAPFWRRAFVRARGYLGVSRALALCLASWPARSLRSDWSGTDAAGPSLVLALAPRAGILGLGFTLLLVGWHRDPRLLLLALPHVLTVAVPVAFLLGLVLALGRLSARSTPSAARWLGAAVGLSIAGGLLTFALYGWVTPQANQLYREQIGKSAIPGPRELTLGELQARIRQGQREGKSTVALDVEWHKKWAIPATCLLFGPLAIGLHGLWREPRLAANLALALAATLLLYSALRIGEQAALAGRLGPLPAIWAGDFFLASVACWLIARLPPLRESAAIPV